MIGYGLWGRHHAAAIAKAPGADLAAIACASEATAAVAHQDFPGVPVDIGYQSLLARREIDAVAVVVPNHLHADIGVAALEVYHEGALMRSACPSSATVMRKPL